jgi:hypothetical protein
MSKIAAKVTAALLALTVATGCGTLAAAQRASDTSYDQAEKNRGSAIVSRPVDNSYDQAERNRANGITSGPADTSYEQAEKNRSNSIVRPATTVTPKRDWSYSHGR